LSVGKKKRFFPLFLLLSVNWTFRKHLLLGLFERRKNSVSAKNAFQRWGKWAGYAFVYILNDLSRVSKRAGFDLTQF
jgi:hypothetical protein